MIPFDRLGIPFQLYGFKKTINRYDFKYSMAVKRRKNKLDIKGSCYYFMR